VYGQFSPGDLSEQHKSLEGIKNCQKCHSIGEKISEAKCLECHEQIKILIDGNIGYHGSSESISQECSTCHSEHFGRKYEIIHFDPDAFDHEKSGYSLLGGHKKVECQACHKKDNISNEDLRKKTRTYIGLSTECNSCHLNVHKPSIGEDCSVCHNFTDFKSTTSFDHSKTNFQLTGKHIDLKCDKCHNINSDNKTISFAINNYNTCNTCHKDVHNNQYSKGCATCHITESFKTILNQHTFDHSKTKFPLIGKHNNVKCDNCHFDRGKNITINSKCNQCHKDYHNGEFVNNSVIQDCNNCHTANGFYPSIYTIEKHNDLKFQLQGSHLAIPCENCHKEADKWKFKRVGSNCNDCHKNIHNDYISKKFLKDNQCSGCHIVDSWSAINFEHDYTDFPLQGRHNDTSCRSCHFIISKDGEVVQQFNFGENNCYQCHENIHEKKFENKDKITCTNCHTINSWQVEIFDHAKTGYQLTGYHEKLLCTKCHFKTNQENHKVLKFETKKVKCSDCH